jgi:hypothetical protein
MVKKIMMSVTMMKTMIVVSHVSFQLGQVTLLPSRRTSEKNLIGFSRRFGAALASLLVFSAIRYSLRFDPRDQSIWRLNLLAGVEGLEPPTYGFGDRRSTS